MKPRIKHWTSHLTLGTIAMAMALAVAFVSCSKDDVTGDRLPDGKYLLTFTTVQDEDILQTRVSETSDGTGSTWTDDDQIGVSIGNGTKTGKYPLNADGTIKKTDTPLYWENTSTTTVNGWYPATDETVDLSEQSNGLRYVLKGTGTGSYQSTPQLTFKHQLAKVRVELVKGTFEGDFSNATAQCEIVRHYDRYLYV